MERKYLLIAAVGVVVITLGGFAFGLYSWGTRQYSIEDILKSAVQNPGQSSVSTTTIEIQKKITKILLTKKNKNTVTLAWENLPENTAFINLYRTKIGSDAWMFWKKVSVDASALAAGAVDIALGRTETTDGYEFYAEATTNGGGGTNGEVLWTSTSTVVTLPPTTPPPGTPQSPTSSTPTPPTPTPTSTSPSGTPSSTTGGSQQPLYPAGATPYYNPQSAFTGYTTPQSATFWVEHVDDRIRIGWQNLPTGTNRVIVSRSLVQNGPWEKLLEQQNPVVTGPYTIQIVDSAVTQDHYYRLETFNGTQSLGIFGPVFLAKAY